MVSSGNLAFGSQRPVYLTHSPPTSRMRYLAVKNERMIPENLASYSTFTVRNCSMHLSGRELHQFRSSQPYQPFSIPPFPRKGANVSVSKTYDIMCISG